MHAEKGGIYCDTCAPQEFIETAANQSARFIAAATQPGTPEATKVARVLIGAAGKLSAGLLHRFAAQWSRESFGACSAAPRHASRALQRSARALGWRGCVRREWSVDLEMMSVGAAGQSDADGGGGGHVVGMWWVCGCAYSAVVVKISIERVKMLYKYRKKGEESEHVLLGAGNERQADVTAVMVIDGVQVRHWKT
eukprot:COSAG01_NODE_6459_length_3657_cov_2.202923_7_plen_196_part_00